ncbi:MAG: helix-turn-helix domain-containing protein [Bacteroidetes bacterium]|nr:helix-turn-helix domain-containing protein [Bacteroidota bacterium]
MHKYIYLKILLICLFSTFLKGQDLIVENSTFGETVAPSNIFAVEESPDGFLWLGTESGVVRYDGTRITPYKFDSVPFQDRIDRLSSDSSGNLFATTFSSKVFYFSKGIHKRINSPINLSITSSHTTHDGRHLVGTNRNGAYILESDEFIKLSIDKGNNISKVFDIYKRSSGSILFLTNEGIYEYKNSTFEKSRLFKELIVESIHEDKENNFWVITTNKELYKISGSKIIHVDTNPFFGRLIEEDGLGHIWVNTLESCLRYHHINLTKLPVPEIIASSNIFCMYSDKFNNLWISVQGKGLFRVKKNIFRNFNTSDGLPSNIMYSVAENKSGEIFATSTTNYCVVFKNDKWSLFNSNNSPLGKNVVYLSESLSGDILMTSFEDIFKYTKSGFTKFNWASEIPGIKSMVWEIGNEDYLIGTSRYGLWRNHNGVTSKIDIDYNFENSIIYSNFQDGVGNSWITGSGIGVIKFKENETVLYDTSDGLISNHATSVCDNINGDIWIGTLEGITILNKDGVKDSVNISDGLSSNTVFDLYRYKDYIFIGTGNGLNIYRNNTFWVYNNKDGLPSSDINTNTILLDSKDRLWFATTCGISYTNFENVSAPKTKPNLIFSYIYLSSLDSTIFLDESSDFILLPNETQNMSINFSFVDFNYSREFFIKYRINDEKEWQMLEQHRNINLSNLSPGNYELKISSSLNGSHWVNSDNSLLFQIESRIYQTSAFKLTVTLIIGFFLAIGIYSQFQKRKQNGIKYKNSSLNSETYSQILEELNTLVEQDRIFRDPGLTLNKLAEKLNIHKEYLSQVVNTEYRMNFNEYLNIHRIAEAKKILIDESHNNKTILSIALESGFNSKSTFNMVFKKQTGMTPTEFRFCKPN